LARWYREHGRHALAWRATRDPWAILLAEVMLQQTQVARITVAWPTFLARYPTPAAMAAVPVSAVLRDWDRLGYPRRARWLWECAHIIATHGWPDDLTTLPGIGAYTANAIRAQAFDEDVVALDVNIRRVVERVAGTQLTAHDAEQAVRRLGRGLSGRDRLLALMDLGAMLCTARTPRCSDCPLRRRCASKGVMPNERKRQQAQFAGSFRQRRGIVMAQLRMQATLADSLDEEALQSLVADGLAEVVRVRGRLLAQLPGQPVR
jgi:A/G-specific adenine glycosylase